MSFLSVLDLSFFFLSVKFERRQNRSTFCGSHSEASSPFFYIAYCRVHDRAEGETEKQNGGVSTIWCRTQTAQMSRSRATNTYQNF